MGKPISICRNNEFRRVYSKGKSFAGPVVVTYVQKNRLGVTRIGITTSKKIGNAVARSRCRRVIRAAYRPLSQRVKQGYDLVFVARGRTCFVKSTEVQRAMKEQLQKAGILL